MAKYEIHMKTEDGSLEKIPIVAEVPTPAEVGAVPISTGFGQQLSDHTSNNNNDIHGTQVRYSSSNSTGKPTGTDHALFQLAYNDNWKCQLALDWRTNKAYIRNCSNGVWGSWKELAGTDTIPNVPNWALQSTKPTYTASEVGALGVTAQAADSAKLGGTAASEYAKKSDISSVFKFCGSKTQAALATEPSSIAPGSVFNMTTALTTNDYFIEGSGKTYPIGTNIVCVEVQVSANATAHRWDILAGYVDLSSYALASSIPTFDTAATANTAVKRDANGNINGKYIVGTWLQTTAVSEKALASCKGLAVVDNDGWIYYRSKANIRTELGIKNINLTENSDGTVDISIT